ncbi:hypothetical protein [Streptomyces anulatus]|uniref:hypothetical protein n=1 Tax=Streptomyces anulatus TaxID=1892 RepID=UPI0034371C37
MRHLPSQRPGLILPGRDHGLPAPRGSGTLASFLQRTIFPFHQGAPALNVIAAKARTFAAAATPEFDETAHHILGIASSLADSPALHGYGIVPGGTENHTVLVDLRNLGITAWWHNWLWKSAASW